MALEGSIIIKRTRRKGRDEADGKADQEGERDSEVERLGLWGVVRLDEYCEELRWLCREMCRIIITIIQLSCANLLERRMSSSEAH